MLGSYAKEMAEASAMLAEAILSKESDLSGTAREVDGLVQGILREVGRQTVEAVLNRVSRQMTQEARMGGLKVERRPVICFFGVFGPMQVESPYLYDPATYRSARPVKNRTKITHHGRSRAVERALTDFGAEESFGQAAKRFEEHYGWSVDRTTVLRVVEGEAEAAEQYVQQRLEAERSAFEAPLSVRPGAQQVLVELDGCEIRTGELEPAQQPGKSSVRKLPCRQRVQEWREVRVELALRVLRANGWWKDYWEAKKAA